ncbi:hypothetical protein C8Q80DRAFT_1158921, partial [Daedaleopsis nitida]
MKVVTPFLLSVLGATFALPADYASTHEDSVYDAFPADGLEVRSHQGKFGDSDLLASCPGGPGASSVERADRCTMINIVNNSDRRIWQPLGDAQLNCKGASASVKVSLGGDTTVSQSTTIDANVGFSGDGISIGGGFSDTSGQSSMQSRTIMQAVYVVGVNYKSQTGNIQVNYADRQKGHFIWFTGAKVTILTPDRDDLEFDVLETNC